MRTHDQIQREQLIEYLHRDLTVLQTKYRSYLPLEATRAIENLTKLCASLVDAVSKLEGERGSKAG